jgi:hypothetical protein
MKQLGFTLMLFVVVLSPLAAVCQMQQTPAPQSTQPPGAPAAQSRSASPEAAPAQSGSSQAQPAPLSPPDKEWRKIQKLPVGVAIVVVSSRDVPMHCRFAAATDDALYCDAPESPGGSGWQFDRATVVSVEATILKKNWHPGLVGAMIAGGTLVGLVATHGASAGRAAGIGAIGAVITGAAGAPIAMSQPDEKWETVVYRPRVSCQPAPAAKTH